MTWTIKITEEARKDYKKIEGRKKDNNTKLAHITGTFRTVYICWSDRPRENGGARYG